MFNFVTFHAEIPGDVKLVAAHPKHALERGDVDRHALLDLMGRSARLFHPQATLTLLTDDKFLPQSLDYTVVRAPVRPQALMFDRSAAQLDYLRRYDFAQPVALLDTDILLNHDLSPLLADDFDVALTWRPLVVEPINGGFMVLNNRRPAAVLRFFERFLDVYRSQHIDTARWFGDQAALRDMLGIPEKGTEQPAAQLFEGVKIAFLPCDLFNFTPLNVAAAIVPPFVDKSVLHFKGPRKWMMRLYWQAYLAPQTGAADAIAAGIVARETLAQMVEVETRARVAAGS